MIFICLPVGLGIIILPIHTCSVPIPTHLYFYVNARLNILYCSFLNHSHARQGLFPGTILSFK